MNKKPWLLISMLVLASSVVSCTTGAAATPTTSPVSNTPAKSSPTVKPSLTPTIITTPLARPSAGKSQELTLNLRAAADTYTLVIYLTRGDILDLDWKFVSSPQAGIRFMFTTPDGREMNNELKPLNLPAHPLYDPSLSSQKFEEVVGSHLTIKAGQDQYCGEGYYSLVFSGNPAQSGTVYLRYDLAAPTVSPTKSPAK